MNRHLWRLVWLLVSACRGSAPSAVIPVGFSLPDSVTLVDGSGAAVSTAELLRRVASADLVLLGEVHDNPSHHSLRARLLVSFEDRRPAIVFEQFPESSSPIQPKQPDESLEQWLDRNRFDRNGWRWPLHQPVVEAALLQARSLWGSGVPRDSLRVVVRDGEAAALPHLRDLLARAPLDTAALRALDQELVAGHCGRLPTSMVGGMRAAQTVRDAAMTAALLRARVDGPAWLIAGNGHVRRDIAVPRLLRVVAPDARVLSVGFLERRNGGANPAPEALRQFDLVLITPRRERADPCAAFQVQPPRS